jgi:hypothetical protein
VSRAERVDGELRDALSGLVGARATDARVADFLTYGLLDGNGLRSIEPPRFSYNDFA